MRHLKITLTITAALALSGLLACNKEKTEVGETPAAATGHLDITTTALSFDGANSVTGKAVILHSGVDDCKTQPTGNAGDRLACGVVSGGAGAAGASGGMAMGTESGAMGTEHH